MDADAILEPERKSREKEEDREIDDAAAESEQSEQKNIEQVPMILKAARRPDHHNQTDNDFLQRFDAEGVKDHLKQGREGAQEDAVELSFHDVGGAEFVEVQRENVEEAERDEREAVEKDDFFHAPVGERWDLLEQNVNKSERENRSGHGSCSRDEEVAAIADADFRILREIRAEQCRVALQVEELLFHLYAP